MINIGIILFVVLLGLSLALGMFITWQIRGKRIAALESILRNIQQEELQLEMEKSNLEAFVAHWKEIGKSRERANKSIWNTTKSKQNER